MQCVQCSLKRDLSGRHFVTEEDLQSAVTKFFAKQEAEWYRAGMHKFRVTISASMSSVIM